MINEADPYVNWEMFDPETDEVLGLGCTLQSTVQRMMGVGVNIRIVSLLSEETTEDQ